MRGMFGGRNGAADVRQLVWWDLCSGLGGASQPALDRGWKVWRVDIDAKFKPDVVADVRESLPLKAPGPDVLWASPDCRDFSKWGLRCFFPEPPMPDLSLALGVKSAIEYFTPAVWCVENVLSARPFLNPIFGPPRIVTTGHVLWTNLGFLLPNIRPHKGAIRTGLMYRHEAWKGWGAMNRSGAFAEIAAAQAAVIPYEIGDSICRAVERREAERDEPEVATR